MLVEYLSHWHTEHFKQKELSKLGNKVSTTFHPEDTGVTAIFSSACDEGKINTTEESEQTGLSKTPASCSSGSHPFYLTHSLYKCLYLINASHKNRVFHGSGSSF